MRALAVLPELVKQHEVLVLAGGDAYHALAPCYTVTRIPTLKYHYNRRGKLSNYLNLKRNLPMVLDLFWRGPTFQMVRDALVDFETELVLTDSEAFTHRVAPALELPRITFDHFGLLAYCRLPLSGLDRLVCFGNAFVYRLLFGEPDRAVVSCFFDAPTRRSGVTMVGAVIRPELRSQTPTAGDHLLVYVSKPDELTPAIESGLRELPCPVRVYGTPRRGLDGNIEYKALGNLPFIEDLASCRAVFSTAGNQLCGEVVYFGKPLLASPMECLEQRLNADAIERMGIGRHVPRRRVTGDVLQEFLRRSDEYAARTARSSRNGAAEALSAIEKYAGELVPGPDRSRAAHAGEDRA
jgi:uncharacterized protein (TIGR00661 family)